MGQGTYPEKGGLGPFRKCYGPNVLLISNKSKENIEFRNKIGSCCPLRPLYGFGGVLFHYKGD